MSSRCSSPDQSASGWLRCFVNAYERYGGVNARIGSSLQMRYSKLYLEPKNLVEKIDEYIKEVCDDSRPIRSGRQLSDLQKIANGFGIRPDDRKDTCKKVKAAHKKLKSELDTYKKAEGGEVPSNRDLMRLALREIACRGDAPCKLQNTVDIPPSSASDTLPTTSVNDLRKQPTTRVVNKKLVMGSVALVSIVMSAVMSGTSASQVAPGQSMQLATVNDSSGGLVVPAPSISAAVGPGGGESTPLTTRPMTSTEYTDATIKTVNEAAKRAVEILATHSGELPQETLMENDASVSLAKRAFSALETVLVKPPSVTGGVSFDEFVTDDAVSQLQAFVKALGARKLARVAPAYVLKYRVALRVIGSSDFSTRLVKIRNLEASWKTIRKELTPMRNELKTRISAEYASLAKDVASTHSGDVQFGPGATLDALKNVRLPFSQLEQERLARLVNMVADGPAPANAPAVGAYVFNSLNSNSADVEMFRAVPASLNLEFVSLAAASVHATITDTGSSASHLSSDGLERTVGTMAAQHWMRTLSFPNSIDVADVAVPAPPAFTLANLSGVVSSWMASAYEGVVDQKAVDEYMTIQGRLGRIFSRAVGVLASMDTIWAAKQSVAHTRYNAISAATVQEGEEPPLEEEEVQDEFALKFVGAIAGIAMLSALYTSLVMLPARRQRQLAAEQALELKVAAAEEALRVAVSKADAELKAYAASADAKLKKQARRAARKLAGAETLAKAVSLATDIAKAEAARKEKVAREEERLLVNASRMMERREINNYQRANAMLSVKRAERETDKAVRTAESAMRAKIALEKVAEQAEFTNEISEQVKAAVARTKRAMEKEKEDALVVETERMRQDARFERTMMKAGKEADARRESRSKRAADATAQALADATAQALAESEALVSKLESNVNYVARFGAANDDDDAGDDDDDDDDDAGDESARAKLTSDSKFSASPGDVESVSPPTPPPIAAVGQVPAAPPIAPTPGDERLSNVASTSVDALGASPVQALVMATSSTTATTATTTASKLDLLSQIREAGGKSSKLKTVKKAAATMSVEDRSHMGILEKALLRQRAAINPGDGQEDQEQNDSEFE